LSSWDRLSQAPGVVSEPEIARTAVVAIKQALCVRWERVRPIVRRGAVTLEGTLEWNYQRDLAEGAVRNVKAVSLRDQRDHPDAGHAAPQ
jgi:hypothetical protein